MSIRFHDGGGGGGEGGEEAGRQMSGVLGERTKRPGEKMVWERDTPTVGTL